MTAAPVCCRRFIGRDDELKLALDRCREAAAGKGAIVLVAGDAGIGKTRFLARVAEALAEWGTRCVGAQCFEHGQSPLGPLAEVLRELDIGDPRVLREAPLRLALARWFPGIYGVPDPSRPPPEAGAEQSGQFAAIAEALRRFGEAQTTVVAIDDLHWADLASLDCLQYLSTKIAATKLVLFLSYRTDELHRRHPLTAALGRLQREGTVWHITLGALSAGEMRAFVHSALEGHTRLEETTLHEIVALAEGSPLFTEELLKAGVERKTGRGSIDLPPTIRAAALDRLALFEEPERALLIQAAVLGRRFEVDFLARISGLGVDAIVATLRRARELQLIVEEQGEPVRYSFRHALVREALYSELLTVEARPLHARIATQLEQRSDAADLIHELAYHWWAARVSEKAATFNERAGELAGDRLAYDDAATFYERALEFLPDASEAQARVYEKLGNMLRIANAPERAIRAFERALAYYRTGDDWQKLVALTSNIAREYWLLCDMDRSLLWRFEALQIASRHPEHSLRFAAIVHVANHHARRGDAERASEFLAQAGTFRGERPAGHQVGYHNSWGLVQELRGEHDAAIAHYRRSIELAATVADLHSEPNARLNLGFVATPFADFEVAGAAFQSAAALARERFLPGLEAYALAGLASMQLLAGDYGGARNSVEAVRTYDADPKLGALRIALASPAIVLGLRSGEASLVEEFAREELLESAFRSRETRRIAPLCAAFAEWYARRGAPDRAHAIVQRALAALEPVGIGPAPWTAVAFCLHGAVGDLARIGSLLATWALPHDNAAGKALVTLVDAFAARAADGDPRPHAERAASSFAALGLPYERAVALELSGRSQEALELYRRIGDACDAQRIENSLVPSTRRARSRTELTEREREVALLVASGMANRAIASQLVISERTVENHLASIFAKLGVSSRSQIAARLARGSSGANSEPRA
ncbi:MAG: ATP-binding protein [Vulcanimicrobiaceae bacterium]